MKTKEQENILFIGKQQDRIIKVINEINTIITRQNLKGSQKYLINFENHMSGNYIEIRVYDNHLESVSVCDYWSLQSIISANKHNCNRERVIEEVAFALKGIRKMRAIAVKYSQLNDLK